MIKIEHWSDFRCPFCYIADAEVAEMMRTLGDTSDIVIVNKAYELDAEAPKVAGLTAAEVFAKKYHVSKEVAQRKLSQIDAYGRRVGIYGFNYSGALPVNTFDAHRLAKYAEAVGIKGMYERLMKAYFVENVNIADIDTLLGIARELGLDLHDTESILNSDRYGDEVRRDEYEARLLGVRSIPAYVFDDGITLTGAGSAARMHDEILSLRGKGS